jgi:sulfopyruvate decarboxylase TPP-binding subunit
VTYSAQAVAPVPPGALARPLAPEAMLAAIRQARVTHMVTVPDTHQRTLLDLLAASPEPELITVCTEDEAMGVNLGLFLGGKRPMLLIQNSGFYAAMNTIRGLSLDARVPACMLIGEFLRDPAVAPAEHATRLVHLLEPTLRTWKIPYYRLDGPDDLAAIPQAMGEAWRDRKPVALLVGAPTAEPA